MGRREVGYEEGSQMDLTEDSAHWWAFILTELSAGDLLPWNWLFVGLG